MSNKFLTRLAAILIIVVLLLIYGIGCTYKGKNKEISQLSNLISAMNDTLKEVRLIDSSQQAVIQSLTTQKVEDFTSIRTKDSTIKALQTLVKKYEKQIKGGGSVTSVQGETNILGTGPTIIEHTNYDTISTPVFPVYTSNILNRWYTAKTRATKDSTHVDIKVINSYDVIIGKEDGKWFANVTNHNPYSSTKSMRAYNVEVPKTKQKRINLILFGGYGYNLQGEVRGSPMIGAGVGYTILSLL